ncbi:MAG TPA: hypothetical protein VN081_06150 [Dongiaceae bacterium]|nr:hypothetical protein [Dongiaceae bacterium]
MTLQLVEATAKRKDEDPVIYRIEVGKRAKSEPAVDDDIMDECIKRVRNLDRLYGPIVYSPKELSTLSGRLARENRIRDRKAFILREVFRMLEEQIDVQNPGDELQQWARHEVAHVLLVLGLFRLHLKLESLTWLRVQTRLDDHRVRRFCLDARRSREGLS